MCLLVYPKSEKQISVLTSLLEEMGIYFEKSEDISYEIPEEHKAVLLKRIDEYKKNPKIGVSYEEIKGKIKDKYGI